MLAAARQKTGLSDFGADDFRARLRVWLQAADEDAELNAGTRPSCSRIATRSTSSNRRSKYGRVLYDLRTDFGIEPAELRKRFDFYLERFPVQVEHD